MGYDSASYLPIIEFTYTPTNTAPYWPAGAAVTVTPNGTIPENTSSLHVAWTAATDDQGDTVHYKVYRNGTIINADTTALSLDDTIGTGNGGQVYTYLVYATDGSLWASTPIQAADVTKNLLTPATLNHTGNIGFSTATIPMTRTSPSNTNGNTSFTYNLTSDITIYNPTVDLSSSGNVLTIWKTGGYPSGPYIKFSELLTYFASAQYNGFLTFSLATTNAYGSTLSETEVVVVDVRQNPTGLGSIAYSGGYTLNTVLYYLPDQRAVTVTWSAATDPLGNAIVYDVYYKVSTDSAWTLARTDLSALTTTISPPTADLQLTYNVKVVAKSTYGTSTEVSGANILIDKYLRPVIKLMARTRLSTSVDISLEIEFRSSFDASLHITTFTYTKLAGATVNITPLTNLTPSFTYSEPGVFLNTSSYTMIITVQDDMGTVLSASPIVASIPITAYIPMLSIRKKGVGIGEIPDGTYKFGVTGNARITEPLSLTKADGTAPMIVTSTTKVANLNVEKVNGKSDADFLNKVDTNGSVGTRQNWGGLLSTGGGTGVILIDLGTTNLMFDMDVSIASYSYNMRLHIRGYTYTSTNNWNLPMVEGSCNTGTFNVRFLTDGSTYRWIAIGEDATVWGNYLSVSIDRLRVHLGTAATPFTISVSTIGTKTIQATIAVNGVGSGFNSDMVDGKHLADLLLAVYPVGAIYTSVVSTSPATLFGGTWAAFAAGRVLVGLNSADTDFDVVEETGGAKTVVSGAHTFTGDALATHIHNAITAGTPAGTIAGPSATVAITGGGATSVGSGTHIHTFTGTALGTHQHPAKTAGTPSGTVNAAAASSVVQPYVVVYMWKRTA
jgi:hypothetical protein